MNKLENWLFCKMLKKVIRNGEKTEMKLNLDVGVDIKRCQEVYNRLKELISELDSQLKEKIHLYVIDFHESSDSHIYIIDNKVRCYKFYNDFCLELYKIICKNIKYKIKDNNLPLNIDSQESIEILVRELIVDLDDEISPNQYYCFSEKVIKSTNENIGYFRFYGIGCDKINENSENSKIVYRLFQTMICECVGYIETPVDRAVLNTINIMEEFAGQILNKYNIIPDSKLITELASAKYEGEECKGCIIFFDDECQDNLDLPRIYLEEIELNYIKIRIIRKYIQMSNEDYCLFAKKRGEAFYIYGMDKVDDVYRNMNDYIFLKFEGYRKWAIENKNGKLLERKGEKYYVPDIKKVNSNIEDSLIEFFGESDKCKYLLEIINYAKKQYHGTMIVFTKTSKDAVKLSSYFCEKCRGIALKGINLNENPKMILSLSAIDGALIIDMDGKCYAIGVILDGIADYKCDMARGARYNSALTFITNKNFLNIYDVEAKNCRIFVFSEDKTVDILSDKIVKKE